LYKRIVLPVGRATDPFIGVGVAIGLQKRLGVQIRVIYIGAGLLCSYLVGKRSGLACGVLA
jgi:hypothetical protein